MRLTVKLSTHAGFHRRLTINGSALAGFHSTHGGKVGAGGVVQS
jgi:hypothetical protein